jgi:hypothetical protein
VRYHEISELLLPWEILSLAEVLLSSSRLYMFSLSDPSIWVPVVVLCRQRYTTLAIITSSQIRDLSQPSTLKYNNSQPTADSKYSRFSICLQFRAEFFFMYPVFMHADAETSK